MFQLRITHRMVTGWWAGGGRQAETELSNDLFENISMDSPQSRKSLPRIVRIETWSKHIFRHNCWMINGHGGGGCQKSLFYYYYLPFAGWRSGCDNSRCRGSGSTSWYCKRYPCLSHSFFLLRRQVQGQFLSNLSPRTMRQIPEENSLFFFIFPCNLYYFILCYLH